MSEKKTPNKPLDDAIKKMLKDADDQPFDMRIKALNTAISWEKAKGGIMGDDSPFDPDQI
jgi:hypothetical protein